jgi:ubiquinone/menaquinone biosynthesis C-methylase UbiE
MPKHEVSTEKGYELWAASYDQENNPLIIVEERRLEALLATLPPVRRVLDVGTGTGRHALRWARQGAEVTAIDFSPHMLAVARRRARAENLPITFVEAPIERGLPFPAGQFDLVICALALCHLADLDQAVSECSRILRPGGYLLITDFHPDVLELGWRTAFRREYELYQLPNPGHTRSDYLKAMEGAGCEVLEVVDVPVREIPWECAPPTVDPDEWFEQFGDRHFCLIVLARRGGWDSDQQSRG